MSSTGSIIAIGGGGFTHETDSALDDYVFAQTGAEKPAIGFIGTASGDSEQKIGRFYERVNELECSSSHLSLYSEPDEVASWVLAQDIIYVGGGNTAYMLEVWNDWKIRTPLIDALKKGTTLAGVSAGAVCWFEQALSDSMGGALSPLSALGITPGSCCPHFDSEPQRKTAFRNYISNGVLQPGIGIDDGVGVHIRDGNIVRIVSARPDAGACRMRLEDGAVVVDTLDVNTCA